MTPRAGVTPSARGTRSLSPSSSSPCPLLPALAWSLGAQRVLCAASCFLCTFPFCKHHLCAFLFFCRRHCQVLFGATAFAVFLGHTQHPQLAPCRMQPPLCHAQHKYLLLLLSMQIKKG